MELSVRMRAAANLVTPGQRVADIGTDHAYIPVWLVQHDRAVSALAMDVREGPLTHARASISKYGLTDRITTRLSDGLDGLTGGEADCVIMTGMGGMLMIRLLERGLGVLETVSECVLGPQSDLAEVRAFLQAHHWMIADEEMVLDAGKYYTLMRVVHGETPPLAEAEALYGPVLIRKRHPVLREYLDKEMAHLENIRQGLLKQSTEKSRCRLGEIETQIQLVRQAVTMMSGAVSD